VSHQEIPAKPATCTTGLGSATAPAYRRAGGEVLWAAQLCDVQQRRQRRAAALALHRRAGRGVVRQRVEQRHAPVMSVTSSRGGCQNRWHSLVSGDHGDPTTSRFDTRAAPRTTPRASSAPPPDRSAPGTPAGCSYRPAAVGSAAAAAAACALTYFRDKNGSDISDVQSTRLLTT
jgi:hypothetical protein